MEFESPFIVYIVVRPSRDLHELLSCDRHGNITPENGSV